MIIVTVVRSNTVFKGFRACDARGKESGTLLTVDGGAAALLERLRI
jgi:hypothetical protein